MGQRPFRTLDPGQTMSTAGESTPDYLPARMLNEFVYCPRLFYYEWVEGVFVHNRETVEGSLRHQKLDGKDDALAPAEEAAASGETIHSRSVTLSSETHRLIAKMDLIEGEGGLVTPVDYKRGSPREKATANCGPGTPIACSCCAQATRAARQRLSLRRGVIYYVTTKQRVRVAIDERLVAETLAALEQARQAAASEQIPPPLVDSPKCPRCSLVGICLPDETLGLPRDGRRRGRRVAADAVRYRRPPRAELTDAARGRRARLVPARDDLRPLYLNTQGLYVGKSGQRAQRSKRRTRWCRRCGSARSASSTCSATFSFRRKRFRPCARTRCRSRISRWAAGSTA